VTDLVRSGIDEEHSTDAMRARVLEMEGVLEARRAETTQLEAGGVQGSLSQ
jgi:hypothetical protein